MLDGPWEELLHYGLLLGAFIQLMAIAAIFVLPSQPKDDEEEGSEKTEKWAEQERKKVPTSSTNVNKKGKKDKSARKRR